MALDPRRRCPLEEDGQGQALLGELVWMETVVRDAEKVVQVVYWATAEQHAQAQLEEAVVELVKLVPGLVPAVQWASSRGR